MDSVKSRRIGPPFARQRAVIWAPREWIKEALEANEILSLNRTLEIVKEWPLENVLELIRAGLICPEAINFCHLFASYKGERSTSRARYFQYNIPRQLVDFTNVLLQHSGPGLLAYSAEYTVMRKLTNSDKGRLREKLRTVSPLTSMCRFVIRKALVDTSRKDNGQPRNTNHLIDQIEGIPVHIKDNFLKYGDLTDTSS